MKFEVGQELPIPAWWKHDELVNCRIDNISRWLVKVRPLEGNPHLRYISWRDLKRIFPNLEVPDDVCL